MTKLEKILGGAVTLVVFVLVVFATRQASAPSLSLGAAGPLYRDQFNSVFLATTTTITSGGVTVVSSSSYTPGAATYVSIVNSGSYGVSCYPIDNVNGTESTSGLTYGGGWFLAANGGAISLDSVGMYGGTIWCLTSSTSTTVGIVAR